MAPPPQYRLPPPQYRLPPRHKISDGCAKWVGVSAGSILDISKYRDTCERSISILDGIAILRYIE